MQLTRSRVEIYGTDSSMIQLNLRGNDNIVIVAPGVYMVADPIMLFPEITDWTIPVQTIDDRQLLLFQAHAGPGIYADNIDGRHYLTHSGLLGLIPFALIDCERIGNVGNEKRTIKFDVDTVCLADAHGKLHFGPALTIDTRNPVQ